MSENKENNQTAVNDEELENVSGGIWPFSSTRQLSDDDLEKVAGGAHLDQSGLVKTREAEDGAIKLGKGKQKFTK